MLRLTAMDGSSYPDWSNMLRFTLKTKIYCFQREQVCADQVFDKNPEPNTQKRTAKNG